MRISDWSSDVCSSDLCVGWRHVEDRQDRDVLLRRVERVAVDDVAAQLAAVGNRVAHRVGVEAQRFERLVAQAGGVEGHARGAGGQRRGRRQAATERMTGDHRSEEHTSELQSLMRISYAVFCLKKQKKSKEQH